MAGVIFPLPTAQGADRSNQPAKSIIPESRIAGAEKTSPFRERIQSQERSR